MQVGIYHPFRPTSRHCPGRTPVIQQATKDDPRVTSLGRLVALLWRSQGANAGK
jgi:hypothetical protein